MQSGTGTLKSKHFDLPVGKYHVGVQNLEPLHDIFQQVNIQLK